MHQAFAGWELGVLTSHQYQLATQFSFESPLSIPSSPTLPENAITE